MVSFHEEKKPVSTETYECDFCDKTFSRPDNVSRHIKAVHEGKKPFPCEECDKTFAEKRSLNHHMLSFHEEKMPLSQLKSLKESMSNRKWLSCDYCEFTTVKSYNLKIHIKAVHDGNKPYECETCEETFARKDTLLKHYARWVYSIMEYQKKNPYQTLVFIPV